MAANPGAIDARAISGAKALRLLPPYHLVSLAGVVMALIGFASLTFVLRQPYLGLHFTPAAMAQLPPVVEELPSFAGVTSIEGTHGATLQLRSDDLEREPDVAFPDYASFDGFLRRQDQLSRILHSGRVILHGEHGANVTLRSSPHRPLSSIPFLYWYQLLVGAGCWMCGACIWAFRRGRRATLYMALFGLALLVCVASAAIYTTRELALPGPTFRLLSAINHWAGIISCAAFVTVLWHYPRQLARVDIGPWLIGASLLVGICDSFEWIPFGNYGMQVILLIGALGGGGLALLQWWFNRRDPIQRASLQWFLISWCVGFGVYLSIVTVPALAGFDNGNLEGYAFGGCLLIAIGLALGIARYRLFELGTWWFRFILFLLGGAAVILVDILLTALLRFDNKEAIVMSLSLVSWGYFPLRQWLHRQIYTRIRHPYIGDLPAVLHAALGQQPESTDRLIPEALERLYAPLTVRPLAPAPDIVKVTDNGLALQVPGIVGLPAWEARWPNHGTRLFSTVDARTMTAVRDVMEKIAAHEHAMRHGAEQERARLTQDLHDDIGARLLTLLHRHPGAIEREVRDILERLRSTVHGLDARPLPLAQCLDEWRAEAAERCNAANVRLAWQQPVSIPHRVPGTTIQIDLARILREAISNALVHAHPACVTVTVTISAARLHVAVENDGAEPGTTLDPGLGMRNMATRIERLDGTLKIGLSPSRVRIAWEIPLPPMNDPAARGKAFSTARVPDTPGVHRGHRNGATLS